MRTRERGCRLEALARCTSSSTEDTPECRDTTGDRRIGCRSTPFIQRERRSDRARMIAHHRFDGNVGRGQAARECDHKVRALARDAKEATGSAADDAVDVVVGDLDNADDARQRDARASRSSTCSRRSRRRCSRAGGERRRGGQARARRTSSSTRRSARSRRAITFATWHRAGERLSSSAALVVDAHPSQRVLRERARLGAA